MYDGNFSAQLFKPKVPGDDVHLGEGTGFMVGDHRYKEHLKVAKDSKQVCNWSNISIADVTDCSKKRTCHEYDAINKVNLLLQHILYTGVGGACCAWHGCWIPHCVVNFERGEVYIFASNPHRR